MNRKRIVITGIGILSPIGKGREQFWKSLKSGDAGYRPITLFNTDHFPVHAAGEISDFDATEYMGKKGLRSLDRSTRLLVSAARLAIDDSKIEVTEGNTHDIGVAIGTTFGSINSINNFDEITLKEGPRYTNPALFPNTVINSPASQISIWHNIKGFNTTISTGFTASHDALSYAYDFLQLDRAKIIFAGAVEEMCLETFYGFYALKFLSGSQEGEDCINCPFDRRRNGIVFGEGACVFAVEDLEHALERRAPILGEITGFGHKFDPYRMNKYNPQGRGMRAAMSLALGQAGIGANAIDYVCANANSTPAADKIETEAIKLVFGKRSYKLPVSAIKSMTGECYSVSGAFGVAASLGSFQEGFLPPTINLREPDPACDLDYVPNQARKAEVRYILVNSFGPNGNCASVILKKFEP